MIGYYIPHKKEGEKIVLMLRRHPFILFLNTYLWVAVMVVVPIIFLILRDSLAVVLAHPVFYPVLVIFFSSFYLFSWLAVFNQFVDYYLDVWIVTNFRIINTEQRQLFSHVMAENELDKIQDVTAEIIGVFPTFLDYGDVLIQTAAEQERFRFEEVPHPAEIKRKIMELCNQLKQSPLSPESVKEREQAIKKENEF